MKLWHDEEEHDEQENLDHVHLLEEKRNYYRSCEKLTRSDGLVLVRNDLEALAHVEEHHNEQENLDHVHLLEEKEKLLPFL